nr:hypothetical protein [Baekduia soli]
MLGIGALPVWSESGRPKCDAASNMSQYFRAPMGLRVENGRPRWTKRSSAPKRSISATVAFGSSTATVIDEYSRSSTDSHSATTQSLTAATKASVNA